MKGNRLSSPKAVSIAEQIVGEGFQAEEQFIPTQSKIFLVERKRKMQAYCMKCRTKREMKDTRAITLKNGRPATQGTCPVCGKKMFRIGRS